MPLCVCVCVCVAIECAVGSFDLCVRIAAAVWHWGAGTSPQNPTNLLPAFQRLTVYHKPI